MAGNKNSGGHNKKSTHLHVLAGTFRKDRHGDHETPEPPTGKPTPPKPLTGEAKAEWNRMVNRLEEARTLSIVDDAALYQYALLFAETENIAKDQVETRRLSLVLKRSLADLEGSELVAAAAEIVKLRYLLGKQTAALRMQRMALRQYLVEFGMTPSARSRVKMPKGTKPAVDPIKDKYFGAGRQGA